MNRSTWVQVLGACHGCNDDAAFFGFYDVVTQSLRHGVERKRAADERAHEFKTAHLALFRQADAAVGFACRHENGYLAYGQDELALHLPGCHELERVCGSCERQRLRDVRAELALAVPGAELAHALAELPRLAAGEVAPEDADDRSALEEGEVERQLGDLAGGEADHEEAAAPGDGA